MPGGMDRLKDRLGGAYDLLSAEDCRKVVEALADEADAANARERLACAKLKGLAMMVLNLNPAMREEARKVLSSGKAGGGAWSFISAMAGQMDSARKLSDERLVEEVLEKVWASYDMSGRESALVAEMVERLRKRKVPDEP